MVEVTIRDVCGILGALLVALGFWLIYAPVGLIVAGGFLLTFAVLSARGDALVESIGGGATE